ncbi:hypothetical protein D3C81_722110 [compost metagenome]
MLGICSYHNLINLFQPGHDFGVVSTEMLLARDGSKLMIQVAARSMGQPNEVNLVTDPDGHVRPQQTLMEAQRGERFERYRIRLVIQRDAELIVFDRQTP